MSIIWLKNIYIYTHVDWLFLIYVYYTCWHILVTCIWPDGILQVSGFQPGKWRHTSYETIAPMAISYWNVIVPSHVFNMCVTCLPMHYVFMLENVWKYNTLFLFCVRMWTFSNPLTLEHGTTSLVKSHTISFFIDEALQIAKSHELAGLLCLGCCNRILWAGSCEPLYKDNCQFIIGCHTTRENMCISEFCMFISHSRETYQTTSIMRWDRYIFMALWRWIKISWSTEFSEIFKVLPPSEMLALS